MSDFLVIGGGIAGVSAAARLSELGKVTLLEREEALAYHASGRSAAMFEETYGKPSTIALNRASKAEHEARGVLSPRGLMLVGTQETEALFAEDLTTMAMEELSFAEAQALCPILNRDAVTRIGHRADAWDIDTDALVQGFAREVRANGGAVRTGAEVTGITRDGGQWRVSLKGEEITAPILVNAAGAWVDVVARMAGVAPLGFTPLRRSMARIAAPGGRDVSAWPMVFGAGETWYFKPDAGALIVSPAEEDPSEPMDAWADDMVLAEGLARYQEHVTEEVTRPLATWAGLRTFAPDRQLVIGPDAKAEGFYWCAGQGGYGMQTAPAASRLLADRVAGRAPLIGADVAAALDPGRFD